MKERLASWSKRVAKRGERGIGSRERTRISIVTTSLSGVRAFFVSPTITFHASLWAVPNPPPYSARPHIDTICSWKISIRFTRWRTVASEIKGIVDVFRVSLVSCRCQGICPSLVPGSRLWFHKRNFVLGLLSTRRFIFRTLSLPLSLSLSFSLPAEKEDWWTVWQLRVHRVTSYRRSSSISEFMSYFRITKLLYYFIRIYLRNYATLLVSFSRI